MNTVINKNGTYIDYETAIDFMDDQIREEIHANIAPCTEQEFFTEYEKRHYEKFGEEWILSKRNPIW